MRNTHSWVYSTESYDAVVSLVVAVTVAHSSDSTSSSMELLHDSRYGSHCPSTISLSRSMFADILGGFSECLLLLNNYARDGFLLDDTPPRYQS